MVHFKWFHFKHHSLITHVSLKAGLGIRFTDNLELIRSYKTMNKGDIHSDYLPIMATFHIPHTHVVDAKGSWPIIHLNKAEVAHIGQHKNLMDEAPNDTHTVFHLRHYASIIYHAVNTWIAYISFSLPAYLQMPVYSHNTENY